MRRHKVGILSMVVILALGLTGCGTAGQVAGDGATATGGAGVNLNQDYTDALPVATQLVVGTLKLDETGLAVTADQAQQLIPLWQAYRTLETSQTAAQQERDALLTQIEETMTADQVKQIAEMKLTAADMQTVFRSRAPQAQGTPSGTQAAGGRQTFGQGDGGFAGGGGFPRNGGGGFTGGGGFAGGGGGFNGGGGAFFGGLAPGETPNPQAIETLRAQRSAGAGLSGVNPGLINVVIQYLQEKSGATPVATPTAG
jgi:hypothetical protein